MLSTLKDGFERIGHEVVYPLAETDFDAAVDRLSKECDAGLVIAPDDQLYTLTKLIESNTVNLGCPSDAVKNCTDKLLTSKILHDKGILVPRIVSLEELEHTEAQRYVGKPRYGCAAENVCILNGNGHHADILPLLDSPDYIITEFIDGDDISSSVIAGNSSVLPLTINKQCIRKEGQHLRYEGGFVPYNIGRAAEREIMRISKKVVSIFHCKGYVGIDFVLADEERAYVVDVNPRPTTSIVGIARVLNYDVADLILRAKFGTLPNAGDVKTDGRFVFNLS